MKSSLTTRGVLAAALLAGFASATPALAAHAIAKGSGAALCSALTQADFKAVGVHVNAKPSANVQDDGNSAYCVFRGSSGASGGVELDIFYSAGSDPQTVKGTEKNVLGSDPASYVPARIKGADDSWFVASAVSGGPPFAYTVVRRGDLVFTISLPAGPQARRQLLRLSATALARLR